MSVGMSDSLIGRAKEDLDTPALCLDLDVMDANSEFMIATCRTHGIAWRPHAKCHKSPEIARRLVDAGAIGVTCATLREAETMAAAGITDLLIANMIAGRRKVERLVELTKIADPIVCVDDLTQAQAISAAMEAAHAATRVLVEVEIGMQRVGANPTTAAKLGLAIARLPGIRLAGFMAYEGHLLTINNADEKETAIRAALGMAMACKSKVEQAGVPCPIFSCGGTGSFPVTARLPGVTEIQSGGAIFMDAFYREACGISDLQNALSLVATVISRPTDERAVIDAGRKALNVEIHPPRIVGRKGLAIDRLSAEHGVIKIAAEADEVLIGEVVEIIPGYADLTTSLHTCFHVIRDNVVIDVFPIHK